MADIAEDDSDIEKLYEYADRLHESEDKSQNAVDYMRIIDAAKGSVKAKQLAAYLIPRFFKFFPTVAKAVEVHFALCGEDQLKVRLQAIRELPLLCKDTPEHLAGIVDVLGIHIETEEEEQCDAVHRALVSLLRQCVRLKSCELSPIWKKDSLEALLTDIQNCEESVSDNNVQEVLKFIKDKVEMESHMADLVKKILQHLTGKEVGKFSQPPDEDYFYHNTNGFREPKWQFCRPNVTDFVEVVCWRPYKNQYHVSCDGVWTKEKGGWAVVVRDDQLKSVKFWFQNEDPISSQYHEWRALEKAFELSSELDLEKIHVTSDAQNAIYRLRRFIVVPSQMSAKRQKARKVRDSNLDPQLQEIFVKITKMITEKYLKNCMIEHSFRQANAIADYISKTGTRKLIQIDCFGENESSFDRVTDHLAEMDRAGITRLGKRSTKQQLPHLGSLKERERKRHKVENYLTGVCCCC